MHRGHAVTYLADYFPTVHDEQLQKEAFLIDESIQDKYKVVARQFSKGMTSSVQTNVVTYETLSNGVHVHVGWYADGFITTALDGADVGKQVIIVNGSVVGISFEINFYDGYFTHNYTWAKVVSYSNYQAILSK